MFWPKGLSQKIITEGIPAPVTVTDLAITPQVVGELYIQWSNTNPRIGDGDIFVMERSLDGNTFSELAQIPYTENSYTDTGLEDGTEYFYRLKVIRWDVSSPFCDPVSATTLYTPVAPSGLTVTPVMFGQNPSLRLNWTDNSDNETNFVIAVKIGAGSFSDVDQTAANAVSYNYIPFTPGQTYTFKVKAINGSLESAYSNEVEITPGSPTVETFDTPGASSWQAPSSTSVYVEVWGAGGGGGPGDGFGNAGAGAGGGAYSSDSYDVTEDSSYDYTVGAGGTGGTEISPVGVTGGDSWWGTSSTIMAKGGVGGTGDVTAGTGGAAASGFGSTKRSGGNGALGASGDGGGGGGSATSNANGGNASGNTGGTGQGAGGNGGSGSGDEGDNGSAPGGGGGGGAGTGVSGGGNGAAGRVRLTYY